MKERQPKIEQPHSPKLIVLTGFMGSGKTTLGGEIASILGRPYLDIDRLIEERTGMTVKDIFARKGESYFREVEHQVWREIIENAEVPLIISTGGGTLTFERNWDLLRGHDAFTIFLDENFEVLWQRIKNDPSRPLVSLQNLTEEEARERIRALLEERRRFYERADLHLNPGEVSEGEELIRLIQQVIDEKMRGK